MSRSPDPTPLTTRRALLRAGAMAPPALIFGGASDLGAMTDAQVDEFAYEVTFTDAEWRARLTDAEYFVPREGGTEVPHSSLNAFESRDGTYSCRGCDLVAFVSDWKVPHFDIGWAFFRHARADAVLTAVECHCHDCGRHFGHILNVKGEALLYVNGNAFDFRKA